jgi:hypothetical protein
MMVAGGKTATEAAMIDVEQLRRFRENDLRARQMVDTAVVFALGECRGEIDDRDVKRFAHDVAALATTSLLKMIYEDDGELRRLREERDHYKRLAEEGLRFLPPRALAIKGEDAKATHS